MAATHLLRALAKFSCGPGKHSFRDTGMGIVTVAAYVPGQEIATSSEAYRECSECGIKAGGSHCLFCEDLGGVHLQVNDGTREFFDPVCTQCHADLLGESTAWRVGLVGPLA